MLQTRQLALRFARRLPAPVQRRFESSHSSHDSHSTTHDTHHAAPQKESFGAGFYVLIGMLPVLYWISFREASDQHDSFLAKLIPDFKEEWEKRNHLHTLAVEQAGYDRALFLNSPRRNGFELRTAEVAFNGGSPYNRSASNSVNLEAVMNHYKKKNEEMAAKIEKKTPEQRYAGES